MQRMTKRSKRRKLAEQNGFSKNDTKKILCADSSFAVKEAYNSEQTLCSLKRAKSAQSLLLQVLLLTTVKQLTQST
jgi:hypothetical protein